MRSLLFLAFIFAYPVFAETVVPTRTIRAQTLISASDLTVKPAVVIGAYADIDALVGQEARVALYAGRPVRRGDVGPPAIVDRNQLIAIHYSSAGLTIQTEGRSLERAGIGDMVRVMNLSSRTIVMGLVQVNGVISVSN